MDTSDTILTSKEGVYGVLYVITNATTGKQYVGQTVSHRLNHGKYRPFGALGRLKDHISEALCNTKKKQCTYLNNAIRKYGECSFTVQELERCPTSLLNEREQWHIDALGTLFPNGYNLTKGGKQGYTTLVKRNTEEQHKQGCKQRALSTRAKISSSLKMLYSTTDESAKISQRVSAYHMRRRIDKFLELLNGCMFEVPPSILPVKNKNGEISGYRVTIAGVDTKFAGKHLTLDQSYKMATSFLHHIQSHLATHPNCGDTPRTSDTTLDEKSPRGTRLMAGSNGNKSDRLGNPQPSSYGR